MNPAKLKILLATGFALLAFAGNSVFCRLALGDEAIDAASFTVIRLLSGILVLVIILLLAKFIQQRQSSTVLGGNQAKGSWLAGFLLFLYAVTFSYAYVSLDTGIGALILFGAVQITMILISIFSGNRLHYLEWTGVVIAFSGFVYLVMPSLSTPSMTGFILMTISGVAWGVYTVRGRGCTDPISDTAYNFMRTLPFIAILLLVTIQNANLSQAGIMLAVMSGAIASGVGYSVWYFAIRGLSVTQAAAVQLLVPIIAAIGGVLFANEVVSQRLVIASCMVLGGIMLLVLGRSYLNRTSA
ncbi:DMT family transporter [Shewanella sp. D64]|uniref:DMT family transporter n=1 Tax=unclassified Shewanella TaxID=196818 RepID=UPI0022BA5100|nr:MULTISPECIES: DMT family transporter [unclassified Shewanella]MEC4724597.1 DMT family transporter [Shewanella sp. D64]MEC4736626.1 DMT family transporter [Shewanella sp. E94]WBJ94702.1 DMT family transporter [Shewanella sp. MTB7]